jgi:hypothetical protein
MPDEESRAAGLFVRSPLLAVAGLLAVGLVAFLLVTALGPLGLLLVLVVGGLLLFRRYWQAKLDGPYPHSTPRMSPVSKKSRTRSVASPWVQLLVISVEYLEEFTRG